MSPEKRKDQEKSWSAADAIKQMAEIAGIEPEDVDDRRQLEEDATETDAFQVIQSDGEVTAGGIHGILDKVLSPQFFSSNLKGAGVALADRLCNDQDFNFDMNDLQAFLNSGLDWLSGRLVDGLDAHDNPEEAAGKIMGEFLSQLMLKRMEDDSELQITLPAGLEVIGLAEGLNRGKLIVHGDVGDSFAWRVGGSAKIELHGNAGHESLNELWGNCSVEVWGNVGQNCVSESLDAPQVFIHGNAASGLGLRSKGGFIKVTGDAGMYTGLQMGGNARLVVDGNVGPRCGEEMQDKAEFIVGGNAGDNFGEEAGGHARLEVKGNVGTNCGNRCQESVVIIVRGDAGDDLGCYASESASITVEGNALGSVGREAEGSATIEVKGNCGGSVGKNALNELILIGGDVFGSVGLKTNTAKIEVGGDVQGSVAQGAGGVSHIVIRGTAYHSVGPVTDKLGGGFAGVIEIGKIEHPEALKRAKSDIRSHRRLFGPKPKLIVGGKRIV